MKKSIVSNLLVGISILLLLGGTAWADPYYHVSIDVYSLSGSDFELEIDLFDNSGIKNDSWALIDNVHIKDASSNILEMIDFEDSTLQGFEDWLNPDSVDVVPGTWWSGNYMMRIDEDPVFSYTIAYRDFLSSPATTLSFDFQLISDGTEGLWGQDTLVFSILDPLTPDLDPFPSLPGLYGVGDVLEATASGAVYSPGVEVELVPVPPALLLGIIGIGSVGIFRKLGKSV